MKDKKTSKANGVSRAVGCCYSLTKEELKIIGQCIGGALSLHLGNDRFEEDIPWYRIQKLKKKGLIEKRKSRYYATIEGEKLFNDQKRE